MAALDQIEPFDTNWMYGNQLALKNAQDARDRQMYQTAGDLRAQGDDDGAINALIRGGDYGKAQMMRNWNSADETGDRNTEAGNLLASGDRTGAVNTLYKGGDLGGGMKLQGDINGLDDRKLKLSMLNHAKTSDLLRGVTNQDDLMRGLDAAEAAGLPVSQYRAIAQQQGWQAALKVALSQTGQVGEYLKAEQDARQALNTRRALIAEQTKDDEWTPDFHKKLEAGGVPMPQQFEGPDGRKLAISLDPGVAKRVAEAETRTSLAKTKASAKGDDDVKRIQDEYAKDNPGKPPLPWSMAKSTATALTAKLSAGAVLKGWKFDDEGKPVEPIWGAPENTALGFRQQQYDPEKQYTKQFGKKVADVDAAQVGREAQAVIVDRHTDLAAGLAGGWEPDTAKLTPTQRAQRKDFEDSIGGIKGNIPKTYQTIKGEIAPDSNTPAIVRELTAINQMMKAEATRLATMGQGAVAEGVRKEFDGVIGNFLNSPSTKTYLQTLAFTKKIMGEFKDVPMVGAGAVQKLKDKTQSPGRESPSLGHVEDGYRFKGGDPSKASNWEAVR